MWDPVFLPSSAKLLCLFLQDVLWQNVGLNSSGYLGAAVLAWTLFALMAIFYLIPVGAVQALLQVDKLERFKFFKVIMDVSLLQPDAVVGPLASPPVACCCLLLTLPCCSGPRQCFKWAQVCQVFSACTGPVCAGGASVQAEIF